MNTNVSKLNAIKENVKRIIDVGVKTPTQFKGLTRNLEALVELEDKVKKDKDNTKFLKDLKSYEKVLINIIGKEIVKQKWIKDRTSND